MTKDYVIKKKKPDWVDKQQYEILVDYWFLDKT